MPDNEIVPLPSVELVKASEVPSLLQSVRPVWQAKSLIDRVRRLLEVDPSSACQRLFNASIHDLKEKVVIAGIDIANEAAKQYKLPPISNPEDVENYSTAKLINLAYRMGLLTRPEWRRVSRCYEIRRDLEHEDDEYEAGVEDCIYIFKTCIEVILAVDPVHLLRVTDVKDLVEQSSAATPAESLIEDYARAPQTRQEEISKFLISVSLDKEQPDIVQQNAYTFLVYLESLTQNNVKLKLANYLQDRLGRTKLDRRHVRIAVATGVLPYLRRAQVADFYEDVYTQMKKVGGRWDSFSEHGELLRSFQEVGGLRHCTPEQKGKILKWLVLAYLGEPGGKTRFGNVRHVFYSDVAAPLIRDIIGASHRAISDDLKALRSDKDVSAKCKNQHVARRFESLLDLVDLND